VKVFLPFLPFFSVSRDAVCLQLMASTVRYLALTHQVAEPAVNGHSWSNKTNQTLRQLLDVTAAVYRLHAAIRMQHTTARCETRGCLQRTRIARSAPPSTANKPRSRGPPHPGGREADPPACPSDYLWRRRRYWFATTVPRSDCLIGARPTRYGVLQAPMQGLRGCQLVLMMIMVKIPK